MHVKGRREGGREVGHTGDRDSSKKTLVCILPGDGDADRRMFGLFRLLRSNNKRLNGGRWEEGRKEGRRGAGAACWSSFLLLPQAQEELSADLEGGAVLVAGSSQWGRTRKFDSLSVFLWSVHELTCTANSD